MPHEVTVSLEPGSSSTLGELAESLGGVPRILLRDTAAESDGAGPQVPAASLEMPAGDRTGRYQLFGEIARGGWGPFSGAVTPISGASWPSRSCSSGTATTPTWSAGSSRKPRSAGSSSTRGSSRSTSWAPSPTAARTSP